MIGIKAVSYHICSDKISNIGKSFGGVPVEADFIRNKIGIESLARKEKGEKTSDLCAKAFENLVKENPYIKAADVDCVCLCTQNGDSPIPHTSAVLQEKLGLPGTCAAFDLSLGCSGYVYALDIVKNLMAGNGFKTGLIFTCDPYSEIIDPEDKNTSLIFGDGASVTLLAEDPVYTPGKASYYSDGSASGALIRKTGGYLFMDGRAVFNFVMKNVPVFIIENLKKNGLEKDEIDLFILHQASKYVVDNLAARAGIDKNKVPFIIEGYGNTVSSSIPIALSKYFKDKNNKNILLCGFGVGLSIASMPLYRSND